MESWQLQAAVLTVLPEMCVLILPMQARDPVAEILASVVELAVDTYLLPGGEVVNANKSQLANSQ